MALLACWAVPQARGLPAPGLAVPCQEQSAELSPPGSRSLEANAAAVPLPTADGPIRCQQLSLCLLWMQLFQDSHAQPGDVVAFDLFCGDLNFDTCSPGGSPGGRCGGRSGAGGLPPRVAVSGPAFSLGDGMEQGHEIFNRYTDPCRIGPRKDHPWAIGG